MGAFTPHCGRSFLLACTGLALGAALAAPAGATPILGTTVIEYFREASVGPTAGAPTFGNVVLTAGELTSAGSGHPTLPHAAPVAGGTFISPVSIFTAPFSAAPPVGYGAAGISTGYAVNFGTTAYTAVSMLPTLMGPDAVPGSYTTVTNTTIVSVANGSGFDNPGYVYTALAVRFAIIPGVTSYAAVSLTMDFAIDNPVVDFAGSLQPLVLATDGAVNPLPDVATPNNATAFAVIIPVGIGPGGAEIFDAYAATYIPGLNVEPGGILSAALTFTGIIDPASFEVIEFPQSLLDPFLPAGPALASGRASEVPEPATLALLGAALLMLSAARGARTAALRRS